MPQTNVLKKEPSAGVRAGCRPNQVHFALKMSVFAPEIGDLHPKIGVLHPNLVIFN